MNYPEFVIIDNKRYDINTDFRIAIQCNEIASKEDISDVERALAVIYLLFGEKGLYDTENHEKLLNFAIKFIVCNSEKKNKKEKPDMDFIEDMDYIEASFMSDYNIDLSNTEMHWWKFYKLINGLSNSEFGNCCVLNRVRNIRNIDIKEIEDKKERNKIIEAKKNFELKKNKKENHLTKEQKESMEKINKILGI